MKTFISIILQILTFLLVCSFNIADVGDTHYMSNGEDPAVFVRNKIKQNKVRTCTMCGVEEKMDFQRRNRLDVVDLMVKSFVPFLTTSSSPPKIQVMVFARSYGPHNDQAKQLLKDLTKQLKMKMEFLDVDLMEGFDSSLILLELQELTGQWSFPNIFIGGKHVGGNNEIDQKHAIGELETMLREAGQDL